MSKRKLFTTQLSEYTRAQLAEIAKVNNMTLTQVVTLAIDEMAKSQGVLVQDSQKGNTPIAQRVVYIYGLCDPNTANVRYVGKTYNPKTRLAQHLYRRNETKHKKNPCSVWIEDLKQSEKRPDMIILEESNDDEWQEKEQQWIARLTEQGANLLNVSSGGHKGKWIKTYQAWDEDPAPR